MYRPESRYKHIFLPQTFSIPAHFFSNCNYFKKPFDTFRFCSKENPLIRNICSFSGHNERSYKSFQPFDIKLRCAKQAFSI